MELPRMNAVSQLRTLPTRASDQFSLVPSMHFPTAAGEAFAVEFDRFVAKPDGVAQCEQLFELLSDFALNFDCPWIAYGSLTLTPDQKFLRPDRRDPALIVSYPEEWQERYFEKGYDRIDPLIKKSRKCVRRRLSMERGIQRCKHY